MKLELKDWLNSIFWTKEDLMTKYPECKNQYPAFIVNRIVASHLDCLLYAQEMNEKYMMSPDMQYKFYLHSVRKNKRFTPPIKKDKIIDIQPIIDYYNVSYAKAEEYLKVLSTEQIQYIKKQQDKGGYS